MSARFRKTRVRASRRRRFPARRKTRTLESNSMLPQNRIEFRQPFGVAIGHRRVMVECPRRFAPDQPRIVDSGLARDLTPTVSESCCHSERSGEQRRRRRAWARLRAIALASTLSLLPPARRFGGGSLPQPEEIRSMMRLAIALLIRRRFSSRDESILVAPRSRTASNSAPLRSLVPCFFVCQFISKVDRSLP